MKNLYVIFFLAFLPAVLLLGHDFYLSQDKIAEIDLGKVTEDGLPLSDVGWLVVRYTPDFYDWMKESAAQDTWANIIVPILRTKGVYILASFGAAIFSLFALLRIIGLWPYSGQGLLALRHRNAY